MCWFCDFGVVGIDGRAVLEFAESAYGDVEVLFQVGNVSRKVRDHSECGHWGMR